MPQQTKFLIAPLDLGQQTDLRPWLIPDQAFERLRNAYVWRGRLRKRFGTYYMGNGGQKTSRLRINVGTIPDPGGVLLGNVPGVIWQVGQAFSVLNDILTVVVNGAGAMISTGASTGVFNTATGGFSVTGTPGATVFWYPSQPVMGLLTFDSALINEEPLFALDTQFAYEFVAGGWDRLGLALWTSTNAQFFWGTNWRGINADDRLFFVTNYNVTDRIKYWDGAAWTTFAPFVNVAMTRQLFSARILIPFKNRLIALNTIETNGTFVNRCRFSKSGSPISADSWFESSNLGGFIDAPTNEQITTAEFVKDRLIVFFERSTWELVYNGNYVLPFVWQQINTELGAESTFSIVPFDKVLLAIGETGVNACNGANVERIDELIPDEVWNIHNGNQGIVRVHGIRDYFTEQVYWTFPNSTTNPVFPNQVLIYDYRKSTWAFNDDSFTTFGYFQPTDDRKWQDMSQQWQLEGTPWNLGTLQSQFRDIVAGNQEGYVCIVDQNIFRNAGMLQITDISIANPAAITVINHNLQDDDAVYAETVGGSDISSNTVYRVVKIDDNTINLQARQLNGTFANLANTTVYDGGGTLARVSRIDILTKQYNFFAKENKDAFVQKVNFMVSRTDFGKILIDYFVSASSVSMVTDSTVTGAILGTNVLNTFPETVLETQQDRYWRMIYFQAEGNVIQFNIIFNDAQLYDPQIAFEQFTIHAMLIFAAPTARLE